MDPESVEDILKDSLQFLGEEDRDHADDGQFSYGPLILTTAPKEGKANTLLADHVFSPSLLLAERIERGLVPVAGLATIELGAGTALPSLVAATQPAPPALVVATDHPDPSILTTLRANIARNAPRYTAGCTVRCAPHEWGTDPRPLLALLPPGKEGYDLVVLSDLLHFDTAHAALLRSATALLARAPAARLLVAAGLYTRARVCAAFLRAAEDAGLQWVGGGAGAGEDEGREGDAVWRGAAGVGGLSAEALGVRKGASRWWVARWAVEDAAIGG